jgi:hypothetical protein
MFILTLDTHDVKTIKACLLELSKNDFHAFDGEICGTIGQTEVGPDFEFDCIGSYWKTMSEFLHFDSSGNNLI